MRITIILILLFHSLQLFSQHFDTLHLKGRTVILGAYDDDKIIKQGDSLSDTGNIRKAIEKYTIVVELTPTNKYAFSKRGFAYLQLDNYKSSLNDYDRELKLTQTIILIYQIGHWLNGI
jgi:tetratricopeptide (TPR) repeat protein